MKKKFEEIDNKISKIFKNKIKLNWIVLLSFVIIFILLLAQHMNISMYFDDFGNASLSYSYWTPDVAGTNYSFSQLIEWATNIYQGWGGRVLYAIVFIIPLLRHSITAYMLVQTFVITGIIYFIYKIIKTYTKKNTDFIPIGIFVLYLLIDMFYLRHGIYWASASVLYVWPLLPLTMLIYFYRKNSEKIKNNEKVNLITNLPLMILLTFFATFSQEQVGIAVIAFLISYVCFDHLKDIKKFLKIDLPLIMLSIASYLFLFLAPGNWLRMDTNIEFANMNFFEKIAHNYPDILKSIFVDKMNIFIAILTIGMFYITIKLFMDKYKKNKKYLYLLLIIPFLILFGLLTFKTSSDSTDIQFILFGTIWLISMFVVSIVYFLDKKQISFCAIEISAVSSIFCLLMSPVVGGRTCLPFIFMLFIVIGIIFMDIFKSKYIIIRILCIILFGLLFVIGIKKYSINYNGYADNKPINDLNFNTLESYDGKENTIKLYKVKDSWFGSTKSYEEPSMDFWIKEYFDIPQEVTFEWIDIYN